MMEPITIAQMPMIRRKRLKKDTDSRRLEIGIDIINVVVLSEKYPQLSM